MKNKKIYLEFMRIIACFFVIVNHTMSYVFCDYLPGGKTWCVSVFVFFLSKFSVNDIWNCFTWKRGQL